MIYNMILEAVETLVKIDQIYFEAIMDYIQTCTILLVVSVVVMGIWNRIATYLHIKDLEEKINKHFTVWNNIQSDWAWKEEKDEG